MNLRTWCKHHDITLTGLRGRLPRRFRHVDLSTLNRIQALKIKRPNPDLLLALYEVCGGDVQIAEMTPDAGWAAYVASRSVALKSKPAAKSATPSTRAGAGSGS